MTRLSTMALLLLAAGCWGCLGVGVEFAADEDFSSYRTWAWLPRLETPASPFVEDDGELAREIERQTEAALAARGFVFVEEALADFFVTYHVEIVTEIVLVSETQPEQMVSSMHDSPSYGVTRSAQRKRVYERGRLVIDVADGAERQLVWRGSAESKYRGSWKPHARAAVVGILERFPPDATGDGAEAEVGAGS